MRIRGVKGGHQESKCPQKDALYSFQTKLAVNLEAEYEIVKIETSLVENVEHPRMGALKYLSTLQKRVEEIEELVERGLMYIEARVNHRAD